MIRVGICDDDPQTREFLQLVLKADPLLKIAAVCGSGEGAVAQSPPMDVWLMDLRMPGMGGRAACEAILARNSKSRVVFLTSFPEECVEKSMKAGAHGYLYKDEHPANIIAAVRAVAAGLGVGSRAAVANLVETRPSPDLNQFATDNVDVELARLILAGQSNREMAKALHLSESGLKKRLNKLMQRAGVVSRPMLMAKLYGSGRG